MKLKEITSEHIGKYIKCRIQQYNVNNAKIVYRDERYYILQNKCDGSRPFDNNTDEFKYSWVIGEGTIEKLKRYEVYEIELIDDPTSVGSVTLLTQVKFININQSV